jgi:hypothetical protein
MQDGGRSFSGSPDDEPTRTGATPVNRRARPQQSRYFSNDLTSSVDDELFEEFEDDYRSGSDYDTEFHRGVGGDRGRDRDLDQDFDQSFDQDLDRDFDSDDRDDRDEDGEDRAGGRGRLRARHGRGKDKRQRNTEGAAFIPLFSRKAKAAESSTGLPPVARPQARSAHAHSAANTPTGARKPAPANPFGDLGGYLVPILAAVVVVMVLVVLLLNR